MKSFVIKIEKKKAKKGSAEGERGGMLRFSFVVARQYGQMCYSGICCELYSKKTPQTDNQLGLKDLKVVLKKSK